MVYGYASEQDIIDEIIDQELAGYGGWDESGRRGRARRQERRAARRAGRRGGGGEPDAPLAPPGLTRGAAPNLQQQIAAAQAAQMQQYANLGFMPAGGLAGFFGIAEVIVPAGNGQAQSTSTAQEPTQLHRLMLDAIDPTAVITPATAEAYLRIANIRLGAQSMFNNNVPMTISALKSNATLSGVMSRVILPGQQLSIDFINRHPTIDITVGGAALGPNS